MKIRFCLFVALLVAVPALMFAVGGRSNAETDCGFLKHAVCAPEAAHSGEQGYLIHGSTTACLSDFIPIDPGRKYELSGWLRSGTSDSVNVNFGFECYDADKRLIQLVEVKYNDGTLSRLAVDAQAGDDFIVVEGSPHGYTGHPYMPVAFHARADYADLPNRDLSPDPKWIVPEELASGTRLAFEKPLTNDYPKGTVVRQHNRIGATHQWTALSLTDMWQEYRHEIVGGSAYQIKPDRFRPGTRYVRLIVHLSGPKDAVVHADDLALTAVGDAVAEDAYVHEPFFWLRTDRLEPLYACGEQAVFKVVKKKCGLNEITNGTLTATFTLDNGRTIAERKVTVTASSDPIIFRETLDEPGFLSCFVSYHDGVKNYGPKIVAAAGFDVMRIKPGDAVPEDLITYWYDELAKLEREVPFDLKVTKESEDANYTCYRLSGANFGGTRITAGLTIPKKDGSFPIQVTVPGAGDASTPMGKFPGRIGLSISVFDQIFGPGDYAAFNKSGWYFYKGAESRETYYYYKSILGAMRMVNFVLTREEWDQRNLFVSGFSQGGGFSLILSGLFSDRVTGVAAGMPGLCDHGGSIYGRRAGWPQLISREPKAAEFAQYFDAALFATHIKCPVIVSAGFLDTMCVPSSVYAAYNGIPGEKRIFNAPLGGHGAGGCPGYNEYSKTFFDLLTK